MLILLCSDKPLERVVEILEWHSFKINEMVQRAHAFRKNDDVYTTAFSDTVKHQLLTTVEYDRAHLLFTYAKAAKTPPQPQSNKKDSVQQTVTQESNEATSHAEDSISPVAKDSTTLTSAQVQPVSLGPTGQTDTDVLDPTMTEVEQAMLDTSIAPEDVPSYKPPPTSVPTQQSTASQPIEIPVRVPNEKMDKALLEAAGKGHTDMIKMLIAKGGDVNFDPMLEEDTPLSMAAVNGKIETLEVICDAILLTDPLGLQKINKTGDNILHRVCIDLSDGNEMVDYLVTHRGFDTEQPGRLGMRPIHYAASSNNHKLVEHLIVKYKVDLHAVDDGRSTALHTAAYKGYLETIKILLDHGADINAWNTENDQPIHCVSLGNYTAAAEFLLDRGAHVGDTDNGTKILTPLYCAIKSKKMETMNLLLARGADPTGDINDRPIHWAGSCGTPEHIHALLKFPSVNIHSVSRLDLLWTPFHQACWNGNLPGMKCLVSLGASLHDRDRDSATPLYLCVQAEKAECVAYLLSLSPDLAREKVISPLEFPLLHKAATVGNLEIVKSLVEAGADPKAWSVNMPIYLPIHYAAQFGFTELTLFLLDTYPESLELLSSVDKYKLTVLGVAASAGMLTTMVALAERGADVLCDSSEDADVMPTLHVAARSGYTDIIRLLAKAGADLEKQFENWSPLGVAVEFSMVESIYALLDCGADIEKVEEGENKGRPVHYAAAMSKSDQLEALMKRGADIEATMNGGYTPLHLAARYGHVECLKVLVDAGAKQDTVDGEGKTALDLAVTLGMVGCVELLI